MIFFDDYNLPVDSTGDGGDSCFRAGILASFYHPMSVPMDHYVLGKKGIRHPHDVPWNNPNNFTRDQLIPLIGGLYAQGKSKQVRKLFWAHAKRLFFCQNIERDYVGTRKYPWPHKFYRDNDPKKGIETRLFDFADPLGPTDILFFAFCSRFAFGIFYPFALLLFCLSCFARVFVKWDAEENQMVVKAYLLGPIARKVFKLCRPKWNNSLYKYWSERRNEAEYFTVIYNSL